ncbi:NAD(P)-dependent oxidoreductase, partial [bacterium]|nr:NAD(P)-dependent oxidoreductase [bacterium]
MAEIKKIAIYGNKGMLGQDLFDELMPDYELIGFDLDNGNITDREGVLKAVGQYMPYAVINCAAYTDVDGCENNVQKAFSVNADGCLFLAQACKEYNVKLVFISSDYVFNGKKETPYTEDEPPDPLNIYGKSKLKGEKYLERTISDFICIRTSGLYGLK